MRLDSSLGIALVCIVRYCVGTCHWAKPWYSPLGNAMVLVTGKPKDFLSSDVAAFRAQTALSECYLRTTPSLGSACLSVLALFSGGLSLHGR